MIRVIGMGIRNALRSHSQLRRSAYLFQVRLPPTTEVFPSSSSPIDRSLPLFILLVNRLSILIFSCTFQTLGCPFWMNSKICNRGWWSQPRRWTVVVKSKGRLCFKIIFFACFRNKQSFQIYWVSLSSRILYSIGFRCLRLFRFCDFYKWFTSIWNRIS